MTTLALNDDVDPVVVALARNGANATTGAAAVAKNTDGLGGNPDAFNCALRVIVGVKQLRQACCYFGPLV